MSQYKKAAAAARSQAGDMREGAALIELLHEISNRFEQVELSAACLEAIDRTIDLADGDVLLCDVELVAYAEHALSRGRVKELWLTAPAYWGHEGESDAVAKALSWVNQYRDELGETAGEQGNCFKGVATLPPDGPFKQVRHAVERHWEQPLDALEKDAKWCVLGARESMAAVVGLRDSSLKEFNSFAKGNTVLKGLSRITELPGDVIVLGFDGVSDTCRMEDRSDGGAPWERDVTPIEIAVNDGCLVPSVYRQGAISSGQTTLGEIAVHIGRGTTLMGKSLGKMTSLRSGGTSSMADRGSGSAPKAPVSPDGESGSAGGEHSPKIISLSRDGYLVYEDDLFYIDSGCFSDGKVVPVALDAMPNKQERYIVDRRDGEVLLISRNGKQCAFYKPLRPTLIANSVFIVRFCDDSATRFLHCWIQSSFARAWIDNGGQMLTKSTLSSLPVPVLDREIEDLTIERSEDIGRRIADLHNQLLILEREERFAPADALSKRMDSMEG